MGTAPADPPGHALTRLRIAAGLSQSALAERSGVSSTAIGEAERGRPVYRESLAKLEAVLGPRVRDAVTVWPPVRGATPVAMARRANGWGRKEAARRAGVSLRVFRRAEAGLGIHPANATKVAAAFGLDVAEVLPIHDRHAA